MFIFTFAFIFLKNNTICMLPFSHMIRPLYRLNFVTVGTRIIIIITLPETQRGTKVEARKAVCCRESWRHSKANKRTVTFLKGHLVLCFFSSVLYLQNYRKLLGLVRCKGDVSNIHCTKPALRPSSYDRYCPPNLHVNTYFRKPGERISLFYLRLEIQFELYNLK